jgi:hypothetical protein
MKKPPLSLSNVFGIVGVSLTGLLASAAAHAVEPTLIGNIDGVFGDAASQTQSSINGWACAVGQSKAISVNLYAGNPSQNGSIFLGTFLANGSNEAAVDSACSDPTMSPHRFVIPLTDAMEISDTQDAFYVEAITPDGLVTGPIGSEGSFNIPTPVISGYVDSISPDGFGGANVYGWSCVQGSNQAVTVSLFANGVGGAALAHGVTNLPSEPAVANACATNGSNFRYMINVPMSMVNQYPGAPVYARADAIEGNGYFDVATLTLSGASKLPPATLLTYGLNGPITIDYPSSNISPSGLVTNTGPGAAASYSISPTLPANFYFTPSNGEISFYVATGTQVSGGTYVVSALNSSGSVIAKTTFLLDVISVASPPITPLQ